MSDAWANFFVAQVGGSAALLGLLFVGISLNLTKILGQPGLPDRALIAMLLLLAVLVVSSLFLVPEQPQWLVGAEVLVSGALIWLIGTVVELRSFRATSGDWKAKAIASAVLFQASAIPYLIAGGLLLSGSWSGLYWFAAGVLISIIKSATDAWVLLVEINR